jgi:hypothetical protein
MGAGLGRLEVSRSDETATSDPHRREAALGNPAADGVARHPGAVRGLDDGQEFGRALLARDGGSLGGHSVLRRDRRFDHAGQAGVIRRATRCDVGSVYPRQWAGGASDTTYPGLMRGRGGFPNSRAGPTVRGGRGGLMKRVLCLVLGHQKTPMALSSTRFICRRCGRIWVATFPHCPVRPRRCERIRSRVPRTPCAASSESICSPIT